MVDIKRIIKHLLHLNQEGYRIDFTMDVVSNKLRIANSYDECEWDRIVVDFGKGINTLYNYQEGEMDNLSLDNVYVKVENIIYHDQYYLN